MEAQIRRNNRVLVSVPALFLAPGCSPESRTHLVDQLRALFDAGGCDVRGRRPWPQVQLRPELRELSRRIALGWRLLERIKSQHSERVLAVKAEGQGKNVLLWQLVPGGRPVPVGRIDESGVFAPESAFFIPPEKMLSLWRSVSE